MPGKVKVAGGLALCFLSVVGIVALMLDESIGGWYSSLLGFALAVGCIGVAEGLESMLRESERRTSCTSC